MAGLTRDIMRAIESSVSRAMTRINASIRRGRIDSVTNGTHRQRVALSTSALDDDDDLELYEPYGFTSVPPAGSTAVVLSPGGKGEHAIALAAGSPAVRLQGLGDGAVAIYVGNNAGTGARVVLRANGAVEINAGPAALVTVQPVNHAGGPALPVARATDPVAVTSAALLTLKSALDTWVPVAGDGGAALKTALATFLALSNGAVQAGTGTITAGGTGMVST